MDTVANGLITIMNNELRRKKECIIAPGVDLQLIAILMLLS
jgi:hypothetical protein